ncbi:MAG: winged helix-turn-helix transcriptional regulator, partial [Candidatus Altiarchaeota archaeon]
MAKKYTKKDIEILQLLLNDSRISQTDMAKKLDLPLSTLQKRLSKVQKELIDKCTIVIDPKKIGLGTYIIRITTDVPNVLTIVEHLQKKNYIAEVYYREDGEIIAKAICSHTKFMESYTEIIKEFKGHISSILLLAQPNIGKHKPIIHIDELENLKSDISKKQAVDLAILQMLVTDSRVSQTEMAKQLKMPLSTLQKRLAKVQEELIDGFTCIVDPKKLGLGTYIARITTDVSKVLQIVEHLKEEAIVSEIFHREDGEIVVKAISNHNKFMEFYKKIRSEFKEDITSILLLAQPIIGKHTPVIPSSELEAIKAELT